MAYKYKERNLKVGKGWADDNGFKHPYNWASAWSDEDKASWGVTFEEDADTSYDDRFYFAKDIPKVLGDTLWVDDDGNAVNDPMTGSQGVTAGLKTNWIAQTKTTGNSLLASTDWYVTRKAEASTAIPSAITTYRSAVRTATGTIETAINACNDLDDFKALFVVPMDSDNNPTGNAPIYDFPEEV
tara:strand:+ start:3652 stop:4206 length:555 start_codon:yes stop_codon:yes gene_type:complete